MLLIRPDGKPVDVDDPWWIANWKTQGFREATDDEVIDYRAKKEAALAPREDYDPNVLLDVFYQTVAPGADGYGMSRDIIKAELYQLGILLNETFNDQKIGLLYSYPNGITQMKNDVRLIMTMFESDKIPEDWPEYLNAADEVLVPSKWCADTFGRSEVSATVVPLGYNDRIFKFIERSIPVEQKQTFTFIHYGSFNMRKGFSEVFKAFNEEFKKSEPVKLILKTVDRKPAIPVIPHVYPNIEVVCGSLSELELSDLLGRANCMVYPSRGEGFGITPLEAMATGLPAIVPNAHGISEYFNSNYMLEVKATDRCPGLYHRFKGEDVGEMVVCDVKDLRRQMRYAYNHQKEVAELGKAASEYVKRFSYRATAERLADIFKKWQATETKRRKDDKFLQVESA